MTETNPEDLRYAYRRLLKFLQSERLMRERVFPAGHKQREAKLLDVDTAITDLRTLGEALAIQFAEAKQSALFDLPTKKGGY